MTPGRQVGLTPRDTVPPDRTHPWGHRAVRQNSPLGTPGRQTGLTPGDTGPSNRTHPWGHRAVRQDSPPGDTELSDGTHPWGHPAIRQPCRQTGLTPGGHQAVRQDSPLGTPGRRKGLTPGTTGRQTGLTPGVTLPSDNPAFRQNSPLGDTRPSDKTHPFGTPSCQMGLTPADTGPSERTRPWGHRAVRWDSPLGTLVDVLALEAEHTRDAGAAQIDVQDTHPVAGGANTCTKRKTAYVCHWFDDREAPGMKQQQIVLRAAISG